MLSRRQEFLVTQEKSLQDRLYMLEISEKKLNDEKESLLDAESIKLKRKLILPSLKRKWKADARKIDAERIVIMERTPRVHRSLNKRKEEIETTITEIKKRPVTSANYDLLLGAQARLGEVNRLISTIDEVQYESH